jgi:hypothetical protein
MSYLKTKVEAQAHATKVANRLIRKLGGNWETSIFYNMGWYFNVFLGTISVNEFPKFVKSKGRAGSNGIEYSVLISDTIGEVGSGLAVWTDSCGEYSKPEDAVTNAIRCMQDYVKNLQEVVIYNNNKFPQRKLTKRK